jgi:hypothetical protein
MDEELGTTVELSAGDLIRTRWTFGGRNDAALTDTFHFGASGAIENYHNTMKSAGN